MGSAGGCLLGTRAPTPGRWKARGLMIEKVFMALAHGCERRGFITYSSWAITDRNLLTHDHDQNSLLCFGHFWGFANNFVC